MVRILGIDYQIKPAKAAIDIACATATNTANEILINFIHSIEKFLFYDSTDVR